MRLTVRTAVLLALILAAISGYYAYDLFRKASLPPAESVPVVVATQEILADSVIRSGMVSAIQVPKDLAHSKALRRVEEATGKIAKMHIIEGEMVLNSKVADPEKSGSRFAYRISEGHRAFTLAVTEVTGVAGFPSVNDRVDILVTRESEGLYTTSTLLQDRRILATGSISTPQDDGTPRAVTTITISVAPDEAQTLALAENTGKVKLVLRSPTDNVTATLEAASWMKGR